MTLSGPPRSYITAVALCAIAVLSVSATASIEPAPAWTAIGPLGGDVRSLAVDPRNGRRVYLGASFGVLYRSEDSGRSWDRMVPGFHRPSQVLDALLVSPRGPLFVGFWDVNARDGGAAKSLDGGETFRVVLDHESVRALAIAPSDPGFLIAGSLSGVFASADEGESWRRITPLNHPELRNVESVAIDPRDPRVIYVGTRHLPWKTTDGGLTWNAVPRGMIDDSDVFTITLDRRNPDRVHATACSGIYRSERGASVWSRVRGMPYSSRRARAFAQDPGAPDTFYAGTTQGLWVSDDDTLSWQARTPLDLVVNDLVTLDEGTVLAATDGSGVLRSVDRGRTWTDSNQGFKERFVSSLAHDPARGRVLAGIWGDRRDGGVFVASSVPGAWSRLGEGLKGREVLSLLVHGPQTLAGTDEGLFVLDPAEGKWRSVPLILPGALAAGGVRSRARILGLAGFADEVALAATSLGVFRSEGVGGPWRLSPGAGGESTAVAISDDGRLALSANAAGVMLSHDGARTWVALAGPASGRVNALAVVGGSPTVLLAATHQGLRRSYDLGATWLEGALNLPDSDYTGLLVSGGGEVIYVSDFAWGGVYRSDDRGVTFRRLTVPGLASDRVWALGFGLSPGDLLAAPLVGGLHLLERAIH